MGEGGEACCLFSVAALSNYHRCGGFWCNTSVPPYSQGAPRPNRFHWVNAKLSGGLLPCLSPPPLPEAPAACGMGPLHVHPQSQQRATLLLPACCHHHLQPGLPLLPAYKVICGNSGVSQRISPHQIPKVTTSGSNIHGLRGLAHGHLWGP